VVDQWEKKTGQMFTINGVRFSEHVKNRCLNYKPTRPAGAEAERDAAAARLTTRVIQDSKLKVKTKDIVTPSGELSAKTGSTLGTPGLPLHKRRFACITPTKIAAKFRKVRRNSVSFLYLYRLVKWHLFFQRKLIVILNVFPVVILLHFCQLFMSVSQKKHAKQVQY